MLFGRRMNSFKDWTAANEDASLEIWQRSVELRELFEGIHPKALENISSSQEKQIKSRNKAHNIDNNPIPIGSTVYVRIMGIRNTMNEEDEYKGPFTIFEITQNGNYKLKNAFNQVIDGSLVRERLKLVKQIINEKYHKIKKILDDRINERGTRKFLVDWADNGLGAPSWEQAENFVDLDIINDYLKKKVPTNNNEITPATKRGPGRPKKVINSNLSIALILMTFFHLFLEALGLNGSFLYC